MNDSLHPIQQEMERIEKSFDKDVTPDARIGEMVQFDGDDAVLDKMLTIEVERAGHLVREHYGSLVRVTPRMLLTIAFLQGVTFARAAENLRWTPGLPDVDEEGVDE